MAEKEEDRKEHFLWGKGSLVVIDPNGEEISVEDAYAAKMKADRKEVRERRKKTPQIAS